MAIYNQNVRDFLHSKLSPTLLPDETIDKQISVANLIVNSNKSNTLSSADEDTIVMVVAGWLSYRAYALELETTKGEVPRSVTTHLLSLERLADKALLIASQMTSTDAEGIEGLVGKQRSELHEDRMAGSLPEGQDI